MREVTGASERPSDCDILIDESASEVKITIPRPRLQWPLVGAIGVSSLVILTVFMIGVTIFIFRHPTPLYTEVIGSDFHEAPIAGRFFVFSGWLILVCLGIFTIIAAVRPMTRREVMLFGAHSFEHSVTMFAMTKKRRYVYGEITGFQDQQDVQGLMESNLVMLLGDNSVTLAASTSEAEKQWLASVLNTLFKRYRAP